MAEDEDNPVLRLLRDIRGKLDEHGRRLHDLGMVETIKGPEGRIEELEKSR